MVKLKYIRRRREERKRGKRPRQRDRTFYKGKRKQIPQKKIESKKMWNIHRRDIKKRGKMETKIKKKKCQRKKTLNRQQ